MSRFQSLSEYEEYLAEEKRKYDEMMERGRKEHEERSARMAQMTTKEKEKHNEEELKKIYEHFFCSAACVDN